MSNLTCKVCGQYLAGRQRQFCSSKCKKRAYRQADYVPIAKRELNCQNCDERLRGQQRRFCSIDCKNRHYYSSTQTKQPTRMSVKLNHCVICGAKLSGQQRQYCSTHCKSTAHPTYPNQKRLKIYRKYELVKVAGGACQRCGYKRNLAGLAFHHQNPPHKQTPLNVYTLIRLSTDARRKELEKCILLCQNCHQEEHSPHLILADLEVNELTQDRVTRNPTTESGTNLSFNSVNAQSLERCVTCGHRLTGNQSCYCSAVCRNRHLQSYGEQHKRGVSRKLEFVSRLGGQCCNCGYNTNLAALGFHHVEDSDKKFQLDLRNLANRSRVAIESELKKCVLLCANCHMETHYPELGMAVLEMTYLE